MSGWFGTYMLARRETARYLNVWGQTVLPPVIQAGLFLLIFGAALGSKIGSFEGVPYLTFIAPALVLQNVIQNAYSNTSSSLFDARRSRYVEDPLTAPISDNQFVLALTAGALSRGVLVGLLTLAAALPFSSGWDIQILPAILVLLSTSWLFGLLGLFAGMRATRWDHIFVPVTFILTPLTFLGGMFYPISTLPANLQLVSTFNPMLYLVQASRASLTGGFGTLEWIIVGVLSAACVGFHAFLVRDVNRLLRQ